MIGRLGICVAALTAALAVTPVQAQRQSQDRQKPTEALPKCTQHNAALRDCHIHDRATYIDMSASRPAWRMQPHATEEFREHERRENREMQQ